MMGLQDSSSQLDATTRCTVSNITQNEESLWLMVKSRRSQTNLLGLLLFGVTRGNETLGIHFHGVKVRSCLPRRWRQAFHLQKGKDVPHFGLIGAVSHRFAFGGENTRSFPLGILRFLRQGEHTRNQGLTIKSPCNSQESVQVLLDSGQRLRTITVLPVVGSSLKNLSLKKQSLSLTGLKRRMDVN